MVTSSGIYFIKCLVNKKIYIGSSKNISKRLYQHFYDLDRNIHPNKHLQNCWNKYKKDNFTWGVVENCEIDILQDREQFYINHNSRLLNVVKIDIKRITIQPEVINTIRDRINEMYKNGELRRTNSGSIKKGTKPWNYGKKYESTDHLKVPKTVQWERTKVRETKRKRLPSVEVYDKTDKLLGEWRSAKDLEEESKKINFCLTPYMKFKNPNGRNGYLPHELKTFNINKSSKMKLPYKGLYFKLIPGPQ